MARMVIDALLLVIAVALIGYQLLPYELLKGDHRVMWLVLCVFAAGVSFGMMVLLSPLELIYVISFALFGIGSVFRAKDLM